MGSQSAAIDDLLGLMQGTSAVVITACAAIVTLIACSGLCAPAKGKKAKSAKAIKNTVLLSGPAGSGKTAMMHQLAFGSAVDTVASMRENAIRTKLASQADDASAPTVTLIDFPGIGQLRNSLLRAAAEAGAIVVVIDAAGSTQHIAAAADLLADLFTSRSIVDAAPPVLIACNKGDSSRARGIASTKSSLEAELDSLKTSRAATSAAGGTGPDADADSDAAAAPLLLGTAGQAFSFDRDSPCPLSWCSAVSKGTPSLGEVEAFIVDSVTSR